MPTCCKAPNSPNSPFFEALLFSVLQASYSIIRGGEKKLLGINRDSVDQLL